MLHFDLFSGYGGFTKALENVYETNRIQRNRSPQSKYRRSEEGLSDRSEMSSIKKTSCVGFSEIDKYAIAVLKYHYPNIKNYGDITKIITTELPDFDLLVGGFPCQSFSIAGKRGGFKDTRGTLFFEIARIAKDKRPSYLLLENVKGLLNHDKGNTFATIISTLDELGYDCQWSVLNSKNFGVPQNRERVFIVGHIRGKPRPKVFPIGEIGQNIIEQGRNWEGEQITNTLRTNYSNGRTNETYIGELKEITKEKSQGYRVYDPQGIASTLAGEAGGVGAKTGLYAIPVLTPNRPTKRQNGRRFKENGESSFTLTKQDIHGVSDGTKIRRLTPTECERLMGLPDDWTKYGNFDGEIKEISDTQRYKLCGNGVVVKVVEEIIKELLPKNGLIAYSRV